MATTTSTGERSEATQSFFVFVRDQNSGQIKSVAIPGDVQIGLNGNPADLTLMGRFSVAATNYNTDNVNKGVIQASVDDTIIGVSLVITPISGRIKVLLPPTPRDGELHFVKDMTETSDTVPIDIYPSSNQTIDGQQFVTLSDPNGSLALVYFNGTWRRLVAGLGSSGGAGAGVDLSYVTINPEASLTHERHLSGSTNIVMTDQGPKGHVYFDLSQILGGGAGTFTYATVTADAYGRITAVAAGATPPSPNLSFLVAGAEPTLPNRRVMSGGLGTTVTDGGAGTTFSFNVDPRIIPFLTGANVFTSPNTFNKGLTGSLTQLPGGTGAYIIGIGGISISTGSNGQIIISGSGGSGTFSASFTGSGGTAVSLAGSLYTISSSIGADKFAAYLLLSASAQDTNARQVIAGSGITFTDTGPGGTLTIASTGGGGGGGTVDPNAPIVVTFKTGSVPSGRVLTAGTGISVVDGGPGGPITVGLVGTTSQSAVVYQGHCTGSMNWTNHAAWTDLIGTIPTNWFDDVQNGITRNGSAFTVSSTGYYHFHAFFNSTQPTSYIAFRLSGSNGTLLQRTTWQNGGQPPMIMDGIIQLNSGASFRLQFWDPSAGTWGVADPIGTAPDQENMRTGDVAIFKIADPLTIQNVPTAAPFGWQTAYFVDFTQQASGSYGGNGTVVYNGVTWHIENYSNARSIGILPTNGLEFSCNTTSTDYGFAGNRSAPLLSLKMSDVFPAFNYSTMPFRVWCMLGPNNITNNAEFACLAIERWSFGGGTGGENYTEKRIATPQGFQAQASLNNSNVFNQTVDPANSQHDVIMLQWLDDRQVEYWTGTSVNGTFPDASTLTLRGTALITNATFFQSPISGSLDLGFVIGAGTNNVLGTLNASFKQFKFDYFQSNPAGILNTNTVITATYTPTDSNDALWWPCHDLSASVVFNYGSASPQSAGHMTASSTSVRFNQPGALKTSIGTNVWGGATNQYLVTNNGITPPPFNTSTFTVSLWVFPTAFPTTTNAKLIHKSYYAAQNTWNAPFDSLNMQFGSVNPGNGEVIYNVITSSVGGYGFTAPVDRGIALNMWNHVGFTFDAPNRLMSCYMNGQLIGTVTINNVNDHCDVSQNGWWGVGNVAIPTSEYWPGFVEDIRVANVVRSANWFAQVWLAGRPDANPQLSVGTFLTGSGSGTSGPDFDVLTVTSPSSSFTTSSITSTGGFTGSLTQTAGGNPYIVGLGSVTVTTNSLGQVLVSGSGGGGGGSTVNNTFIVSGAAAQGQAAYHGYVTSSVWWSAQTAWTPFTQALPDGTVTDVVTQSILRNGPNFTFMNGGLYYFKANFNAYGNDAYISLRLNGVSSSHGIAMERSTYRSTPTDQNNVVLEGILSASIGDTWTLEYVSTGSVYPWTGSNPLPGGGGPMHTGDISIFLISPGGAGSTFNVTTGYFALFTGSLNSLTASGASSYPYGTWTTVSTQQVFVTGSNSRLFIAYSVQSRRSSGGSNYAQICLDGLPLDYSALSFAAGSPVLGNMGSIFVATASQGTHTVTLNVQTDTSGMSITPWGTFTSDHANLFVQEIPQVTGQLLAKAPIYSIPILAGTVASNTSFSSSKQSLGMCYFNPATVQGFGGSTRKYYFRAVLDCFTVETNLSAAIDLNDFNGIVAFPPSTIPGSIMSTSSGTATQLQADLTSMLQTVSGSGLFEARLWRTVSGSLASIATCRNARLDVEFS